MCEWKLFMKNSQGNPISFTDKTTKTNRITFSFSIQQGPFRLRNLSFYYRFWATFIDPLIH